MKIRKYTTMLRKGSKIPYLVKEAESTYNAYPALDTPAIVVAKLQEGGK